MHPAYAAALLNAKVQRYLIGLGGEVITAQDIAHGFALINHEGAQLLGRAKYAGQEPAYWGLVAMIIERLTRLAHRHKWGLNSFQLFDLSRLAVEETLLPKVCRKCAGRSFVLQPKQAFARGETAQYIRTDCPQCNGQGSYPWKEYRRVRTMGVGRWYWRHRLKEPYLTRVLPILDRYEDIFYKRLSRSLR